MIHAQLVVIFIIAVPFGLWVRFALEPTQAARLCVSNVRVDAEAFTPPETKLTKRNIGRAPENLPAFHGQFGVNLRIIPDIPIPANAPKPAPVVFLKEELASIIDTDISVSDILGSESGPFVPEDAEYMFDPLPETTTVDLNIVPCSVLVAVPPVYPWVARERKKEGVAGIIVCIDETGKVTLFPDDIATEFRTKNLPIEKMAIQSDGQTRQFNYVVTYEEPSGWFFARKVAEKLGEWVFKPSTIDGRPVKSLLPIGHAFCLTSDCTSEYVILRNYKHYRSVVSR